MTLIQQTGIQLITAFIAFVLGVLLNRLRAIQAYFNSRRFWRPLLRRDLTLVLGDGFPELQGFEASDVVGRGDLVGSYELTTRFAAMGFRRLQPVFADKMIGDDPSGTGLRKNLIILGGQDTNTLTRDCLSHLRCTYALKWLNPAEGSLPIDNIHHRSQIPELQPTIYAPDDLQALRPVMSEDLLVQDYGVIVRARNPFMPPGAKNKRVVLIYGCYGFGTLAAVLYSLERDFLQEIRNTNEDIECVVSCDVVKDTPQGYRRVYLARHPAGTLGPTRSSARGGTDTGADLAKKGDV